MNASERISIFLQARSSSSRLPMKALLPLGGMPLSLLVARRAMNRGLPLLLATSDDPSDDLLAAIFREAAIPVFRGALDDPLGRFAAAARSLREEDWLVRITGDNPLPDGALIEELIAERQSRGAEYLRIDARRSRLPYGVSAEIFRVSLLREAHRLAESKFDREHITPYIRRVAGDHIHAAHPSAPRALAGLRATIDSARDYERMARVFDGEVDPVGAPLCSLIERLAEIDRSPSAVLSESAPRFMLGTAQLGLEYGIANRRGRPTDEEALALMTLAARAGAVGLDTARAYGDAEERIGAAFAFDSAIVLGVTTKIAPLDAAKSGPEIALLAETSLYRSLHALRSQSVESVLFHRMSDLERFEGAALKRLNELGQEGLFQRVGVSVQSPEEAARALEVRAISEIQFPMNLLDSRFDGFVEAARARPEVRLVARSVFLQGLLVMEGAPASFAGVDFKSLSQKLKDTALEVGASTRLELAIRFARAYPRIDALVIGAESPAQLEEVIAAFELPPFHPSEIKRVRRRFRALPESLLDPSRWPARPR